MLNRFRHHIVGIVVVLGIVLLVASVLARLTAWRRLDDSIADLIQARDLGQSLDHLFSSVLDAETSQRGYLITGKESYLEPYHAAQIALAQEFNRLSDLAQRHEMLRRDLLNLRGLTELRFSEMAEIVKIRREKNLKEAVAAINAGHGKETLDQIRELVGQIRNRRIIGFAASDYAIRENLNLGRTLTLLGGCLAVAAAIGVLYLVRAGYFQDKAQQQLSRQKQVVEKALFEKTAFLADMSHEIRTPMNAILGFSELLEEQPASPRQAHYIHSIRQSGAALLHVINDVLDLSKIESGKLELVLEPTSLSDLCEFLQNMFAEQALQKKLRLTCDSGNVPSALLLDRLRLRQILVNLVSNSLKYTQNGHVAVTMDWLASTEDQSRGTLTVSVEDTGTGIPLERQQAIFEPFIQSVENDSARQQGTGLGLSIVKRLTELMAGAITLQSAPGQGSTFRLSLPNVSVSARLPVGDTSEGGGPVSFNDFAPARILIVDDNPVNRDLLSHIFAETHHRLEVAGNGREAIEHIHREKPDLVLLDLRMPVMDGQSAAAQLRKERGFELLPIIAITASSRPAENGTAQNQFNGWLRKPFSQRDLYNEFTQFLPRSNKEPAPIQPPTPAPVATARKVPHDWQALAGELAALHTRQWPSLHGSLAINETKAFARRLRTLAESSHCPLLSDYAHTLDTHAETFAVREMEIQLLDFPALIERIKKIQKP